MTTEDFKYHRDRQHYEKEVNWIPRLVGIGLFLMILGLVIYTQLRSIEYPELTTNDSIEKQWVKSVYNERRVCFVELMNGMKFSVWGQNENYDVYPGINNIISARVFLTKKQFSDTLQIQFQDKEYKYVIGQTIKAGR
jgi:hypothetical protein